MRAALVVLLFAVGARLAAWSPIDSQILYTCREQFAPWDAPHAWKIVERQVVRESGFDPLADSLLVNPAARRSVGIDQLLYDNLGNFKRLNGGLPIDWRNPFVNVKVGIRYLAELYRRYAWTEPRERWFVTLAAYNEGPAMADRRMFYEATVQYAAWILQEE